jgi:glycosyltransferase involved in cell wall biosynthesis
MREQLRRTLLDSVQHHLIADVPVGIFLSSGMDSTTLVALASEITKNRLNTVTLGFREYIDTPNDETSLATLVADRYRTTHETVWVAKEDFQHELDRLLHAMDQPTIDGVNSYFVSLAAKKAGLKVALSGLGGDELFGSYPSFVQLPRMVKMFKPYNDAPLLGKAFRAVSAPFLKHLTSPKYAGLLEYGGSYPGAYLLRRGMFMPWELPGLLDEEMVRKGWEELQPLQRLEDTARQAKTGYMKVSVLELNWYMRNQLLRDTDWASMAHALEVRTPLVDIGLLKSIAPLLAAESPPNKQDMTSTPSHPLADEVMKRAKTGFAIPVREWLFERANVKERGLRGWAKWLYSQVTQSTDRLTARLPDKERVLVSTIRPGSGGVTQMTDFIVRCIKKRGFEPVLAYYEPYSISPNLSVPSFKLLQRTVGSKIETAFDGCEAHAFGAWLPELEFTHYLPTTHWKNLMHTCKYLVSVSGNCLSSLPYAKENRPFVAWVATPWHADRRDRVKLFPWYRKILDVTFNARVIKRTEKQILRKGTILPLSQYTMRELNSIAGCTIADEVLPMPVNTEFFSPDDKAVATGRVGFAGRFDDPRKNIELLLRAVRCCRDKGVNLTAFLIGHDGSKSLSDFISSINLTEHVRIIPHLDRENLRDALQTLDVFVLPSHQEGLCIAALEAMSSGCPVVSTKCGGPEEFVLNGKTGYLVDSQPDAMADAICRIVTDRDLRAYLSSEARSLIQRRYSISFSLEIFWKAFDKTFRS